MFCEIYVKSSMMLLLWSTDFDNCMYINATKTSEEFSLQYRIYDFISSFGLTEIILIRDYFT